MKLRKNDNLPEDETTLINDLRYTNDSRPIRRLRFNLDTSIQVSDHRAQEEKCGFYCQTH